MKNQSALYQTVTRWLPFLLGLLVIGALTGTALAMITPHIIHAEQCRPPACNPMFRDGAPLFGILIFWLLLTTAVIAFMVKVRPWRRR